MLDIAVIIVAAGRGLRAGGAVPKQWVPLAGISSVARSIATFQDHPAISRILLVVHPDDLARTKGLAAEIVIGGAERYLSVQAGLAALADTPPDLVLIHDAARPALTGRVISDVIAALDDYPAAAPGLPVSDSLWRGPDGVVSALEDRTALYRAQTPQGFHFRALQKAYESSETAATDDVAIARAAGLNVKIVPGDPANIKITTPEDFARVERALGADMDIRIGNGFDVHAFEPGDHVVLCGVKVPHDRSLKGHSDADVGMHAITDALYGAMAEGDIGRHFPPSEARWKDADSAVFLRHATALVAEKAFTISNIDLTLICERPKITPHAKAMIENLAKLTGLGADRISVKATTTEERGFTGRGEGIAALASVVLVRK